MVSDEKISPVKGPDTDAEQISTGEKIDLRLRWFADFYLRPFYWLFGKLGVSPNWITFLGLAMALLCGYLLAIGKVPYAAAAFTVSGILDLLDGYVAKKFNRMSSLGSFLDSVSDRIADAAVYLGLMLYFLNRGEGLYAGLAVAVMVLSFLISYVRAKAETLGVRCRSGLMSRAPRFLVMLLALYLNGLSDWILRIDLWILTVLILETLAERIIETWRALDK
ncbi:MAG: CDP-alcohol phosphatidyltransferase family protein [Actinobacteria bacterium]|nr:CDP-alcohol phosphatidyltransferase family protein [Actinomycetota bacterium]